MLNYVNSVFCAYNSIENNFIIKMRQDEPIDPNDPNSQPINNDIVSIVISRELAMKLAQSINILCKESNQP